MLAKTGPFRIVSPKTKVEYRTVNDHPPEPEELQRGEDGPKKNQNNRGKGSGGPNKARQQRKRLEKEIAELKAEKKEREARDDASLDTDVAPTGKFSEVLPAAPKARLKPRHVVAFFSFIIFALGPPLITGWYLSERAADRFISRSAFSVRTEEIGSAFELLGGVAEFSGSSSTDTEILYQFITSQELVEIIDDKLDLRELWSKGDHDRDPIYAYDAPGTIEDLLEYWNRRVDSYSDTGTGLIELEVQAFSAEDAQAINQAIYHESLVMINRLSAIARDDGTRYAREDLDAAVERLRDARLAIMQFRHRTQIVDPEATIQSQMGILSSLQNALADELIERDVLLITTRGDDPRIVAGQQRIDVIEQRIIEERSKFGIGEDASGDSGITAFAELVGEYESLNVNLEFAEITFQAAQAALDTALAESRRQSRYLAAHIQPTLPQRAEAPDLTQSVILVALFAFLAWGVGILSAYAVRDRR